MPHSPVVEPDDQLAENSQTDDDSEAVRRPNPDFVGDPQGKAAHEKANPDARAPPPTPLLHVSFSGTGLCLTSFFTAPPDWLRIALPVNVCNGSKANIQPSGSH